MAESIMRISQADIASLKEALCAQQQLLQKLYNELDVEREASATAASEALSMILRLQGEKGAVKLEAEQYKRLAEEKMCHAEESLAIFEDIIYQKEMEIAALDYQVQAYRYKLLSMGCIDPGGGEIKFPENLLQRNETLVGDVAGQSIVRRNSAPPIPLKFSYQKKGIIERERSASPETDMIPKIVEEHTDQDKNVHNLVMENKSGNSPVGGINSYWEQIRRLDERVKEITGVDYINSRGESRSSSLFSQASTSMSYDTTKGVTRDELDQVKCPQNMSENETTADSARSLNVLDVFEVPQTNENHKGCGWQQKKEQRKLVLESDEKIENFVPVEGVKSYVKDETEWVKQLLLSTRQNNFCRPSNDVDVRPTTGVAESQANVQQLNTTSEIIEVERQAVEQEASNGKKEELKLLNEIREQLNVIQSEMRGWKTEKSTPADELSLVSLSEAMLHFWL